MSETFKKGQMVPKRLRMVFTHKKTQSNVVFGCDVIVTGRTINAISEPSSGVIIVNLSKGRRMNNGTFQKKDYQFKDFIINCAGYETGSGFHSGVSK